MRCNGYGSWVNGVNKTAREEEQRPTIRREIQDAGSEQKAGTGKRVTAEEMLVTTQNKIKGNAEGRREGEIGGDSGGRHAWGKKRKSGDETPRHSAVNGRVRKAEVPGLDSKSSGNRAHGGDHDVFSHVFGLGVDRAAWLKSPTKQAASIFFRVHNLDSYFPGGPYWGRSERRLLFGQFGHLSLLIFRHPFRFLVEDGRSS
ncbi:hypothetical protein DFH08DRAFT_820369 [Mycena albidolilacea]|uniref:Uncharacterized protein n=1 Tax=Mycena albidolilacea TaxID=1033008 RepID=A0AAD6ZCY5_9AGAR|nr:hypothetical protein DFH08DRAFT_820369 [Mycena albidolilacea]